MKSQRLDMIEEYVLEHKNASLDTLCEKFNVSKNTIRSCLLYTSDAADEL